MQVESFELPQAPPRVRVFGAHDFHVTLGFLGAVQELDARKAWTLIETFQSLAQVQGTFSGVKPLGNPRKPSALSAMIADGREALSKMILEARAPLLTAADDRQEARPPLPHMTIARIQRRAKGSERREALRWAEALDVGRASFTVRFVALYTWSNDRERRLFEIVERHPLSA